MVTAGVARVTLPDHSGQKYGHCGYGAESRLQLELGGGSTLMIRDFV
ncbi:hypothetical protein ACIBI9_39930 [Nonomuraea sp. NPDC050451]